MSKKSMKTKIVGRKRNDLCPCGSELKYKKCHGKRVKGIGKSPRHGVEKTFKPSRDAGVVGTAASNQFMRLMMGGRFGNRLHIEKQKKE